MTWGMMGRALGAVESGFVAAITSATFAVVSGGVASLTALAVIARRLPELRRYTLSSSGPPGDGARHVAEVDTERAEEPLSRSS